MHGRSIIDRPLGGQLGIVSLCDAEHFSFPGIAGGQYVHRAVKSYRSIFRPLGRFSKSYFVGEGLDPP